MRKLIAPFIAVFAAMALTLTGTAAHAGAAVAAPNAVAAQTGVSEAAVRAVVDQIRSAPDGSVIERVRTGTVSADVVKVGDRVEVRAVGTAHQARGICSLTIQALVYGLGAAFFAGIAAIGGGVVLGVAISAAQAGAIAAALSGGTATAAFLASIFCD